MRVAGIIIAVAYALGVNADNLYNKASRYPKKLPGVGFLTTFVDSRNT
jgi:hypothetical protein